jgi:chromosome segregation ATPase
MPVCRTPKDLDESSHQLPRQPLEARLNSLKEEYEKGQAQLNQLQSQLGALRETMLRISGAVMVLEEILSSSTQSYPLDHPSES